jgi:HAD superfamily hydrolase (TIGR01509 family)
MTAPACQPLDPAARAGSASTVPETDGGRRQLTGAVRSPTGAVAPYHAVVFDLEGVVTDTAGVPTEARHGVRVFPGTAALLRRLHAGGVPIGLVTSSRTAAEPLAAAGLADLFDAVVDGTEVADVPIRAKPHPALFLEAARRLHADPAHVAVVEDSTDGVAAARAGGFGWVVGVDRGGQRASLEAAGADIVVGDVAQLDLGALRAGPWRLVYEGFDPAHEPHREALTAVGNGYMATRGAAPESSADGVHYPGSYLAGVYNRVLSTVRGRDMETEHLVNVPNWLPLDLRADQPGQAGAWWSDGGFAVQRERRELDLRHGVLTRHAVLVDPAGRRLHLAQRRLVSMARSHAAGLETTLTAEGWTGPVTVRSGVDAGVQNTNVTDDAELVHEHWTCVTGRLAEPATVLVEAETRQSRIRVAVAARTTVTGATTGPVRLERLGHRFALEFTLQLSAGHPVVIDKTAAVFSSRDTAIASPADATLLELARAGDRFADLLADHAAAWERLWHRFIVDIEADPETRLVLNLHTFHLLQSISPHTAAVDAGVPARGLHGEGYRGHVFWDELFVLPLITLRLPEVTRALLDYRWRRLDAARDAARQHGLPGALFPWQSGSDGREETPSQLFNPRSQRWMPDNSRRQRHVGLAVAVSVWQYCQATGDLAWLAERGAELMIEVARLFTALASYDPDDDRFHIAGVMGPDEYHDGYPDAPGRGLRDSAYTNVLTAWVCQQTEEALTVLEGQRCADLVERLAVTPEERARWGRLSRRMAVPFHGDGILSQFDGYHRLAELDWDRYRSTYGDIGRLDLILEAEGDSTNRYQLSKQADVLMLLYLLGSEDLLGLLHRLGYPVPADALPRTVDYYLARTAHGSTLSRVVHASVLAGFDQTRAWDIFRDALVADLDDTQGGTTGEGIHLGAMAGTVDVVLRTFAGLRIDRDTVRLAPRLPHQLSQASFQVRCHDHVLDLALTRRHLTVVLHPCAGAPLQLRIGGRTWTLMPGASETFPLPPS